MISIMAGDIQCLNIAVYSAVIHLSEFLICGFLNFSELVFVVYRFGLIVDAELLECKFCAYKKPKETVTALYCKSTVLIPIFI
jgi:hypothetical protein